ncbi:MAG: esterase-like activity of phytase family protein, partial [Rhodospirillaceae bacterium]
RPTGAAVAANGDLLVLERYFSIPFGFSSRVRRIKATDIAAGATLDGPVVLSLSQPPINDNFEGIAAEALPDGTTRVLLMTDDNYSGLQRTLLLAVRLANPSS